MPFREMRKVIIHHEIYESWNQNCISYGLTLILSATKDVFNFSDPTSQEL